MADRGLYPRSAIKPECAAGSGASQHPCGRSTVTRHFHNPLPVAVEQLGPRAIRVEQISGLIGALGCFLSVAAFFANRAEFFQSYLFAFTYWGGFSIGGLGVLLIHHTVGGKWGVTIRRLLEAQMRTLPLIL